MSVFDEMIPRSQQSRKLGQLHEMYGTTDLLPLWIADMDFATPAPIREAMIKVLQEPVQGYSMEYPQWKTSIIDWYAYRYHTALHEEWIHYVPGVIRAIVFGIQALTRPEDRVLTCSPVYDPYAELVRTSGRTLVQTCLIENNGTFVIDWEDFSEKARSCALFLLCSPHNPGGVVWDKATLQRIAEICHASGTIVIADEIHCDLTLAGAQHIPFHTVSPQARAMGVVLTSTSKTFNTPGVQGGVAIVPDDTLRARFYGYLEGCFLAEASLMQQVAMATAYSACREWHSEMLAYLAENIAFVKREIATHCPEINVIHGGASYLLFLNASELGLDDMGLKAFFTHQARLALSPGLQYGPGGEGHMRLNVGCPKAVLIEAMKRLASACEAHRKQR